ncbi:MAG: hypothetical protein V4640_00100 [Verrucomicrobiota bacterium]
MQLTRFDRWLREKFVYETHIQTLRPPDAVPTGLRMVNLPDVPGQRYKHLFVARSTRMADALIHQLKENGQMYTTRVVDRKAWFVPFLAPKSKSVTWWMVSVVVISISLISAGFYLKGFVDDPEFRKNFSEALELLKK